MNTTRVNVRRQELDTLRGLVQTMIRILNHILYPVQLPNPDALFRIHWLNDDITRLIRLAMMRFTRPRRAELVRGLAATVRNVNALEVDVFGPLARGVGRGGND